MRPQIRDYESVPTHRDRGSEPKLTPSRCNRLTTPGNLVYTRLRCVATIARAPARARPARFRGPSLLRHGRAAERGARAAPRAAWSVAGESRRGVNFPTTPKAMGRDGEKGDGGNTTMIPSPGRLI